MSEDENTPNAGNSERSKEVIPLLWRNRMCWLPVAGALITLGPTMFVISNLWEGLPSLDFSQISALRKMPFLVAEIDARTFLFLSQLVLIISATVTIVMAGYIFIVFLQDLPKTNRMMWCNLVFSIILLILLVPTSNFYEPIFQPGLELNVWVREIIYGFTEKSFLMKFAKQVWVINKLVAIAIFSLGAAFATALYTPRTAEVKSVDIVTSQRRNLSLILFPGAVFLIAGVLATYAYVRIPSVFLSDNYAHQMKDIAQMITSTFGVSFTLCLAGAYIPASLIISERARNLAANLSKAQPELDIQQWLQEKKLSNSPFQLLTRSLAVLAPFLVSLSQIIANLF